MTELAPDPTPAAPAMPSGPACGACDDTAVVNWRRRPTDTELAAHIALEQSRRDERLLLADPQQPAPVFPPLPTVDDTTVTVYACGSHAITLDGAALIHASVCTAPNTTGVDGCDCTPEPHPKRAAAQDNAEARAATRLPAHWLSGA